MATESFKFWDSYAEALDLLTDEQAGRLVKALGRCVFDGEEPELEDVTTRAVFAVIRKQAEQSKELANVARENGMRGGRPKSDKAPGNRRKNQGQNRPVNRSVNQTQNQGQNQGQKRKEKRGSEAKASLSSLREESFAAPSPDAAAGGRAPAVRDVPCSDVPPADIPDGMAVDATGAVSWEAPEGA